MVFAWSSADVVRYSYFAALVSGRVDGGLFRLLKWLRLVPCKSLTAVAGGIGYKSRYYILEYLLLSLVMRVLTSVTDTTFFSSFTPLELLGSGCLFGMLPRRCRCLRWWRAPPADLSWWGCSM